MEVPTVKLDFGSAHCIFQGSSDIRAFMKLMRVRALEEASVDMACVSCLHGNSPLVSDFSIQVRYRVQVTMKWVYGIE